MIAENAVALAGVDLSLVTTVAMISDSVWYIGRGKAGRYGSVEEFVLAHGRIWTYDARLRNYAMGEPRQCFENAARLVFFQPGDDLTYVEGYAMRDDLPLPIYHAWAVDGQGRVLDPTWRDRQKRSYLGIPFKFSYLSKTVIERESWGPLIVQTPGRMPLLTGEHSLEMAVEGWPR